MLLYILVFIAGATTTGQVEASKVAVSILSAKPPAILAIVLAVAGATKNRSASLARPT